eukprot:15095088-Heterocapsa_arctica.AAC.1
MRRQAMAAASVGCLRVVVGEPDATPRAAAARAGCTGLVAKLIELIGGRAVQEFLFRPAPRGRVFRPESCRVERE